MAVKKKTEWSDPGPFCFFTRDSFAYIDVVQKVLRGETLSGKDADSFTHPAVQSQHDWEALLNKTWDDAERFAGLIEQLPETKLWETFIHEKYGNYYRNLHGIIQDTHYHLGQIVLIKKLLDLNVEVKVD